jgi:hypothetical protein
MSHPETPDPGLTLIDVELVVRASTGVDVPQEQEAVSV